MAETPRTDAHIPPWKYDGQEIVSAEFARELETELNELKRQLAESETHVRIFRAQAEERGRIIETTRLQLVTARQDERGRCAKLCETSRFGDDIPDYIDRVEAVRASIELCGLIAAAIRALPDEEGK